MTIRKKTFLNNIFKWYSRLRMSNPSEVKKSNDCAIINRSNKEVVSVPSRLLPITPINKTKFIGNLVAQRRHSDL